MKILYVKHTSERARKFQIKTIIYEENGKKYVKKQALTDEAIPHLMQMKDNAKRLKDSIVNPKIKLAEILTETSNSLTFEFINGISFEEKYNKAKKQNNEEKVINDYLTLIQTGFKTINFDVETMVTETFKKILGDFNYSDLDNTLCFANISNIDLLFSNIIFQDDIAYIIDYEWIFDLNIPIDFITFRTLHTPNPLLEQMNEHFIHNHVVLPSGFFMVQNQYKRNRYTSILEHTDEQIQTIKELNNDMNYWINKSQELTVKGRIKKLLKFIFPLALLQRIKSIKNQWIS